MANKAPGKHFRKGMSLLELGDMFPDDATAEQWFIQSRWPNEVRCAYCDSDSITRVKHKTMPYRCRDCRKHFSVKTGTVMHASNIGYRKWIIAIYLLTTGIKGTSSMKLHRDIGVTQKTAWYMAHRIREAWSDKESPLTGTVEVDETLVGGKAKYMTKKQKEARGVKQGGAGKTTVVGAKERDGNRVVAKVVRGRDRYALGKFIHDAVRPGTTLYTDDYKSYRFISRQGHFPHEFVKHSHKEYVRGDVHTNGIEGFWSMFKRGYKGIYHHMSEKHLQRYIDEFAGRHNDRPSDTEDQMSNIAKGMVGRRLRYEDLTADPEPMRIKLEDLPDYLIPDYPEWNKASRRLKPDDYV